MNKLSERLEFLVDGADYHNYADDYARLVWRGPGDVPTEAALLAVTDEQLNHIDYIVASKLSVMRYLKSTAEWPSVRALLAGNEDAKEEWDAASQLNIDDLLLLSMSQALGWDAAKIQLIFNEAAKL